MQMSNNLCENGIITLVTKLYLFSFFFEELSTTVKIKNINKKNSAVYMLNIRCGVYKTKTQQHNEKNTPKKNIYRVQQRF